MKPIITIFAATCERTADHVRALELCSKAMPPHIPHTAHLYTPPAPWTKLEQTQFLTHAMKDHIMTDFVMTVHLDGFALHPDKWDNEFLEYDYIGAPWPVELCHGYNPPHRVGNSGFSLRSRKWLAATAELPLPEQIEEDVFVCMKHHDVMVHKFGCKIAPVDLALKFSLENALPEFPQWKAEDSFGFHGYWRKESIR
jgi:hypothetical protein